MAFVEPSGEQLERFMNDTSDGPIVILNLLKFRDQAAYEESADEPARTGEEAYGVYSETAFKKVEAAGGSLVFVSPTHPVVIGPEDEWDVVALVRYPNRQAFVTMVSDPEYQAIVHHRTAAIADSRLIPLTPYE